MNTSPFSKSNSELYVIKSFKKLLSAVIICYQKSIATNNLHLENNENYIRNMLVEEYLQDSLIKEELQVENYIFIAEPARILNRKEIGYTDIMIIVKELSFSGKNNHFTFECKKLDGESALNSEYVKEGMHRFINEKYPTNLGRNGMIGFMVKSCDIEQNKNKINNLISKSGTNTEIIEVRNNTSTTLTKTNILQGFDFSYVSNHQTLDKQKQFELHHLMLDYSQNIV
jgi:hypothetical protein